MNKAEKGKNLGLLISATTPLTTELWQPHNLSTSLLLLKYKNQFLAKL